MRLKRSGGSFGSIRSFPSGSPKESEEIALNEMFKHNLI
jgi:hypothetical protein